MIKLENCPICVGKDWTDLDYLRNKKTWYDKDMREEDEPVGFKICNDCGFITYDYVETGKLNSFYDNQRTMMSPNNIITCNRKNEYHKAFLQDIIKSEWKCLDVGCAQGSFLDLLHNYYKVPLSNLYGTEWSEGFRLFGKHEYNLNITKEIDQSLKYDFISYYHVLEHIQFPDEEMELIGRLLKDDGYLYISVPTFLDILEESSGGIASDLENLYHLNHVNVFTEQSFHNLLNKFGWKVLKIDKKLYGHTVLCQKAEKQDIKKGKYLEYIDILEKQKKAIELMNNKKADEAFKLYPKFPDAYILFSLNKDNMKSYDAQMDLLNKCLEHCPENTKTLNQMAKVLFQWDENDAKKQYYSNNIKKCEKIFLDLVRDKPGTEDSYYFLALIEGKYKKDYDKAVEYLKTFMRINPVKFQESYNLISYFWKEKGE